MFEGWVAFTIDSGRIWGCANKGPDTGPKWQLHEGKGNREWRKKINFTKIFTAPPEVVVSFALLDFIHGEDDFRANVEAENVTNTGFELKVNTWLGTELWSSAISWLAYDKAAAAKQGSIIHSGRLAYSKKTLPAYDLHDGEDARAVVQKVNFPVAFWNTPTVITGFCLVDLLNDSDARAAVSAVNVTAQGFDCKVATWSDSHVWGAAVSWIAIDGALAKSGGGQVHTGSHSFTQAHPAYGLHQNNGTRSISQHIVFPRAFQVKPSVVAFLSSFDISIHDDDLDIRLSADSENTTAKGFELKLATWKDSLIWSAGASWLAYGPADAVPNLLAPPPAAVNNAAHPPVVPAAAAQGPFPGPAPGSLLGQHRPAPSSLADNEEKETSEPPAKKAKTAESKQTEQEEEEAKECKICYEATINTVIIPCGHLCVCDDCANLLRKQAQKLCPICKQKFTSIIKTFIA